MNNMTDDFLIMKQLIKADYERKVKAFRLLPVEGKPIFAGDSMIAYFNLPRYGFDGYINMGIAGDTTAGLMNRLDAIVRQKPPYVIIHIGSNDLVLDQLAADEIVQRIEHIVDELSMTSTVYVISLTPVNPHVENVNHTYIGGRENLDINAINQQLKSLYQTNYIDAHTHLLQSNSLLHEDYTKDGIHLNHIGYHHFAEVIKKSLKPKL
jgi:lysophospholipase L1-like esterase